MESRQEIWLLDRSDVPVLKSIMAWRNTGLVLMTPNHKSSRQLLSIQDEVPQHWQREAFVVSPSNKRNKARKSSSIGLD